MRRIAGVIVIVFVVSGLSAFPALAAAGGPWVVKDAAGHKLGTVRTVSSVKAVFVKGGRDAGEMNRTARGKWTRSGPDAGGWTRSTSTTQGCGASRRAWQIRGFSDPAPCR